MIHATQARKTDLTGENRHKNRTRAVTKHNGTGQIVPERTYLADDISKYAKHWEKGMFRAETEISATKVSAYFNHECQTK